MPKLNHIKSPLKAMSDIEAIELKWLWYPYIPFGQTTLLYGPGGIGKSHITCQIAAAISTGEPLPGQTGRRPPAKVLILSAEDDAGAILRPRLERAGADLTKIFVPEDPFVLDEQGIRDLIADMSECAATFVIIDPIVYYMGGRIDMHKMNEVRSLMGALQTAAQMSGCAIVVVHHSRKDSEGEDAAKAAGSVDFINAVRSALFATKTPGGDTVLRHPKHNYSPEGLSWLYYMDEDGCFHWGETVDPSIGGYEPGSGQRGAGGGREKEKAIAFIKTVLADGPVPAKEIEGLAEDEKIPARTLARAKTGLARSFVKREDGKLIWYWELL